MEHLLTQWPKLKNTAEGRFLFLFLDYDGTLAEIAARPEEAAISEEAKGLLEELSKRPDVKIAVISGRALKDIKSAIGLENIVYVGNHGLEIEGRKIKFESQVQPQSKADIRRIKEELSAKLSQIKGVFVEDKALTLSIHYRMADKKDVLKLKDIFDEVAGPYARAGKIKVTSGKKVFEIRPPVMWDKGRAALWLLARQQVVSGEDKVLPVYIGDDVTDEDAFRLLRKKGLTVFIGSDEHSSAEYYLKGTSEVLDFLRAICRN